MSKGLFNLGDFENMNENDVMHMSINESFEDFDFTEAGKRIQKKWMDLANEVIATRSKHFALMDGVSPEDLDKIIKADGVDKLPDCIKVNKNGRLYNTETGAVYRRCKGDVKHDGNEALKILKKEFKEDINAALKKNKSMNESFVDKLVDIIFNESSEFAHKNPDTNHPEDHFETNGASGHSTSVHSMGTHKPYDASSVTIPGGDSETPKSKPYDAASVSGAGKVTLTSDAYNDALAALKKSFKEGYEIMEMLENANVIDGSVMKQQEAFEEAALIEAMISGPMFEAVNRSDKEKIRDIVKAIRSDVVDEVEKEGLDFYDLGWWNKLKAKLGLRAAGQNFYWQMIGMIDIESQNANDFCKRLTKEFEDRLDKYKILCYQCYGFGQLFNFKQLKSQLAGDTKNTRATYVLFVDRKMNSELTREIDSIRKEVESKLKKDSKDGKKED